MVIVSKSNPLVKELVSLKEKKGRQKSETFLVEGIKMVRECVAGGMQIVRLVVREDYAGETYSLPTVTLGVDAFSAVSNEKTPQGIAAEVKLPVCALAPPSGACIVLDEVSDPSNTGAIVRTAVAAGYREIYCIGGADPYSPKSVRASLSGVFFAKIMRGTRSEVLTALNGVPLVAADMSGENAFTAILPEKFALCIGNEGGGLSEEVAAKAQKTVRIPMGKHTESLNAAVSAGILMYLLKKKMFEQE